MRSLASSFSRIVRAMRRFYLFLFYGVCNTSLNGGLLLLLMKEGGLAWLGILWDRRGDRHDHSNETRQACSLGSVGSIWDRRGDRHDHSNETRQCCWQSPSHPPFCCCYSTTKDQQFVPAVCTTGRCKIYYFKISYYGIYVRLFKKIARKLYENKHAFITMNTRYPGIKFIFFSFKST